MLQMYATVLFAICLSAALSACDGSSEERMISVTQELLGSFVEVQPGAAQDAMASFIRAGGVAVNQRCGILYRGFSGRAGGAVVVDVVFEVRESQLPLAIAASFRAVYTLDRFNDKEKQNIRGTKSLALLSMKMAKLYF